MICKCCKCSVLEVGTVPKIAFETSTICPVQNFVVLKEDSEERVVVQGARKGRGQGGGVQVGESMVFRSVRYLVVWYTDLNRILIECI